MERPRSNGFMSPGAVRVTLPYILNLRRTEMACSKEGATGGGAVKCVPCEGGEASGLKVYDISELQKELAGLPMWTSAKGGDYISRSFVAKNFVAAMAFLNRVAEVAEAQGHHPDLHVTKYRNVEIRLYTHSMGGVTRNDIIEAKLLDQLPVECSPKWLKEHPEAAVSP